MKRPVENKGVKLSGAPNREEVTKTPGYPAKELWHKGPLAFIECVEEIPCNPCEAACPRGAITVGKPITNLPVLEGSKCTGCTACVAACPGLAIYVKDYTYNEKEAVITFPFEYWPLPAKDQEVTLVDEMGEPVCRGKVLKVMDTKRNNHTPLVTVVYPKDYFEEVKSIKRVAGD